MAAFERQNACMVLANASSGAIVLKVTYGGNEKIRALPEFPWLEVYPIVKTMLGAT